MPLDKTGKVHECKAVLCDFHSKLRFSSHLGAKVRHQEPQMLLKHSLGVN